MGLLEKYQDPKLEVDLKLTLAQVVAAERKRLQSSCATLKWTGEMKRRLSDGSRDELALDKRRAHRALHAERQSLKAWGGKEREASKAEQSAGAQLLWLPWHEETNVAIGLSLRQIATWAKRTDNLRFGKTAVVRLTQELEWLAYALRD